MEFSVATPDDFGSVIEHVLPLAASRPVSFVDGLGKSGRLSQVGCVGAVGVTNGAGCEGASLVTLTGDLGAGKTTFTQQLAKHLGVTEPVTSPTFGIMKSYELLDHPQFDQLVHIDAYRIDDISEAGPLRLVELWQQPRTLICLEWPERIAEILPPEIVAVQIEIGDGELRKVTVS